MDTAGMDTVPYIGDKTILSASSIQTLSIIDNHIACALNRFEKIRRLLRDF